MSALTEAVAAFEATLNDLAARVAKLEKAPPVVIDPGPTTPATPATDPPSLVLVPGTDSIYADWTAATPVTIGRDGTDATGSGPWSTSGPAKGTRTFDKLRPGVEYTVTVTDSTGRSKTAKATVKAATTTPPTEPPVTTPPVTTVPTPSVPPTTAAKLASLAMPARGFFDGVEGWGPELDANVVATKFGAWRGDPVDITGTWHDNSYDAWGWGPGTVQMKFRGVLDIAPGGPRNEWPAAAAGSLDVRWGNYLRALRKARTFDGKVWPTIIRPAHEMNGDWYAWTVRPANVADFRATMKRWRAILDREFPEALFALCFNGDTSTWDLDVSAMYEPGVWDLIGVDQYNTWPNIATEAKWNEQLLATKNKNPRGIEAWRLWAKERGLPLYHPEYANGGNDSDTTVWLAKRLAWAKANKGVGAGNFLGGIWFNLQRGGVYGDAYWLVDDQGTNGKTPNTVNWYRDSYPVI